MICVAIALAFAGASIACGITLPTPEEDAEHSSGARGDGREPTSTLGATMPAPQGEEGDAGIWVQPEAGTTTPGVDAAMPRVYAVFVTSWFWSSDELDGLSGADKKCTSLAESVFTLKGRKWAAWLSDEGTAAPSRLGTTPGPWYNGLLKVADDVAQLVDPGRALYAAISFDEKAYSHSDEVWTGTFEDGKAASKDDTCQNWAGTQGQGVAGKIDKNKPAWTSSKKADCVYQQYYNNQYSKPKRRLYCFEIDPT